MVWVFPRGLSKYPQKCRLSFPCATVVVAQFLTTYLHGPRPRSWWPFWDEPLSTHGESWPPTWGGLKGTAWITCKRVYTSFLQKKGLESGFKTMKWGHSSYKSTRSFDFLLRIQEVETTTRESSGIFAWLFFPNEFLAFSLQSLKAYQPIEVMKKIPGHSRNLKLDGARLFNGSDPRRFGPAKKLK